MSEELVRSFFIAGAVLPSSENLRAAVVEEGLPKDAKYRGCFDDPERGEIGFVFEHQDFEEVEEGNIPLNMRIVLRSL